ncbi:hypothetical protein Tco_0844848 [Tanacetum coccineum]
MPEPDQPQDHLSTPSRQQTSNAIAPVFEHGQSSDPNTKDEPLGGSFHASPPRSTQVPPASSASEGAEDLITLTVVFSVVSTLVQKVNSLETELKDNKKLFKDVVGKLVKKVKAIEVKLKTKKRKVVVSDSDQEEGEEQNVDLDALLALANAAVIVDSNIPPGGASNNPAVSSHIPTDVPTGGDFAPAYSTSPSRDPFKRKGVAKPSSPVSERTKKQLADERLSEIEATGAYICKAVGTRGRDVCFSEGDQTSRGFLQSANAFIPVIRLGLSCMAQVHANAGLSSELLGADVNDDNFAERMSTTIYSTGWFMKYVKSLTDEQLIAEFEKIRMAVADLKSHELRRTLKGAGEALAPDTSKTKVYYSPNPLFLMCPQLPIKLDLDVDDETFIKVVSDEDSEDEAPILWSALLLEGDLQVLIDSPMKVMLKHKLEIAKDVVGNDMTTAEQLIRFIKNQLVAAQVSLA